MEQLERPAQELEQHRPRGRPDHLEKLAGKHTPLDSTSHTCCELVSDSEGHVTKLRHGLTEIRVLPRSERFSFIARSHGTSIG
jgi:hypothetical protein